MSTIVTTMPSSSSTRLAVFGATGPSTQAAIARALQAGTYTHALARTPTKLTSQLLARGIAQETLDTYLEITSGNIRDLSAVEKVLLIQQQPATMMLYGVGMSDAELFSWNTVPGHTVCQDGMSTVLQALRKVRFEQKPHLAVISSRGVSPIRDYPLIQSPIYYSIVARPARDKKVMESLVIAAREQGSIGAFTIVRPSVLSSGKSLGMDKIRAGSEVEPVLGYSIGREDVGLWIWEEVLQSQHWKDVRVGITY